MPVLCGTVARAGAVEGLFDRGVVLTSVAVAGTGRDAYWGKVGEVCSDAEKYGAP